MPRNASGVFSFTASSWKPAVAGTVIESAAWNALRDEIAADLNAARPVTAGGTGATNAASARTNLGLGALAILDTVDTAQIDDDAVTTAKILDANVTTAKLADDAVDADKLAAAAVVFASLASAAIASQAQAEAGTATDVLMTPERVAQAIAAISATTLSTSTAQTFPSSSSVSWAHGLGSAPAADRFGFYCVWKGGTANGFVNGDILSLAGTGDDDNNGLMCSANATNIKFAASAPFIRAADGGSSLQLTSSNVDLYLWVRS